MRKILTVDVGGTFTKYAVMSGDEAFTITARAKTPTVRKSHEDFLSGIVKIFNQCNDIEGIGLSLPGMIDVQKGIWISSDALPCNNNSNIVEDLQKLCGVPVTIENDANCAALAEAVSGSLKDVKEGFVLVFGTGVGGAFVLDKKIYHGAHNFSCEVSFTLKDLYGDASGKNFYSRDISALAFQKTCAEILKQQVNGEMIFDLIERGDEKLTAALHRFAHAIAVKIFNLQMLFDPARFAIGGGISARKSFIDAIKYEVNNLYDKAPKYLPRPDIVPCHYLNDANLFGAFCHYLITGGDLIDKVNRH
ncbi:MAG: ROK family protein [Selenomonadaceae bacterium]|nr:ROK family protein [Selenomonadaceae bacterium]